MPTVSKRQRKFMRRVALDKNFAKSRDIKQKVAQEFLLADRYEAKALVHQSLNAWLEGKDDQIWVSGNQRAMIEGLGTKIASYWKAEAVDLDRLVNESIKSIEEPTIEAVVSSVLDDLDKYKGPLVIYGYQIPFFIERAHAVVLIDLSRVSQEEKSVLQVDQVPRLKLFDMYNKTRAQLIKTMISSAKHDDEQIQALLKYDPYAAVTKESSSQESSALDNRPISARWTV